MKKIILLLAFVASFLCSCGPNTELQRFYVQEAFAKYNHLAKIELLGSQWNYMHHMQKLITYDVAVTLSPKIGRQVENWEIADYNKYRNIVSFDELMVELPDFKSEDYNNMLRLQEAYACNAVAFVLKGYQENTRKSIGMEYQQTCELVIAEVLERHPIVHKN